MNKYLRLSLLTFVLGFGTAFGTMPLLEKAGIDVPGAGRAGKCAQTSQGLASAGKGSGRLAAKRQTSRKARSNRLKSKAKRSGKSRAGKRLKSGKKGKKKAQHKKSRAKRRSSAR